MHNSRENKKSTSPTQAAQTSGSKRNASDTTSGKLQGLAKSVGNQEVQARISKGNATRDELLAAVTQRLGAMRQAQLKEAALLGQQRDWWNIVSAGKATKPDPTRWHEAARLYLRAAEQLARGAVGQGAQLLASAQQAEDRAFEGLTSLVDLSEEQQGEANWDALDGVSPEETAAPMDLPPELHVAWEILLTEGQIENPPMRHRTQDPWWTLEDEEEEEEGEGKA